MLSKEAKQVVYDFFENHRQDADEWLNTVRPVLGGRKPIDCEDEEVVTVIRRLEYGIVQ